MTDPSELTYVSELIAKQLSDEPFAALRTEAPAMSAERMIRRSRWEAYSRQTLGGATEWAQVQAAYIFRPLGQGIWADVERTRTTGLGIDIAHSVLLTEGYSEVSPLGDRFEYSYPRPSKRSDREIAAMKAAMISNMPIFFVDGLQRPGKYVVRVAWVIDANDDAALFLLGFVPPSAPEIRHDDPDSLPFPEISVTRKKANRSVTLRPGQRDFAYDVIERYGLNCAMCDVNVRALLAAAHIVPVASGGPDDARNGLTLCALHHAAFDAGLIRINPMTLSFEVHSEHDARSLAVVYRNLRHVRKSPHLKALQWRYDNYFGLEKRENLGPTSQSTQIFFEDMEG